MITLQQAKDQLNITTTTHDEELQRYVDAVAAVVERHTGRVMDQRSITERHRVVGGVMLLNWTPVVALTSVASVGGSITWDVSALDVDPDTGEVAALSGTPLKGTVTVTYTAGYAAGEIPQNYQQGAVLIVQHAWNTQRGIGSVKAGGGIDDMPSVPGFGFTIPNAALEWLGPPTAGIA